MASRWNWSHERALRVPILVFPQELGHNLFLFHGGNEDCNYKPNYNSVMNYACQFSGIDNNCTPPGNGVLNYSSGNRIDLDENNGTCGNAHTTLLDFNDWDNLQFGGWSNADGAMLIQVPQRIITEQPVPAECTN